MHEYLIALRLIHILCGVLWAGGIFTLALFILPAVNASGPEGGKVMRQIAATNHYATVMTTAATLNIIAGLLLYWKDSNGLSMDFIGSPQGIAVTLGATLAIIAYILGLSINRPGVLRMTAIGNEIAAAGGKPTEAQMAELGTLRKRISISTKYMAWLLGITVSAMAIARYLY
jgi:uncharacterized membrane protein